MTRTIFLIIAGLMSLTLAGAAQAHAEAADLSFANFPCHKAESWNYSDSLKESISKETLEDFEGFLSHKITPVQAMADALALRKSAKTPEAKTLAEYWMARSLLESNLIHVAHQGFSALVAHGQAPGVQLAALACLSKINVANPSLEIPEPVGARLASLLGAAQELKKLEIVWTVAGIELRQFLGQENPPKDKIERNLAVHRGGGSYELLAQALVATKYSKHKEANIHFSKFFAAPLPQPLQRLEDTTHILAARSLYTVGRFEAASEHLKTVKKSSNELANSLSELSWAYLQAEKYPEAIGTAMSLQAGGLRHTFTPEAQMVMAMALNELCQFPESVKAIQAFKKTYEKPFDWLKGRASDLYPLAIAHIRKTGAVPPVIASEWVRSPLFISSQSELNLLIDEKDSSEKMTSAGGTEQLALAVQMTELLRELKPRFKFAKSEQARSLAMRPESPAPLASAVVSDLRKLRKQLISYHRLRKAAPIWKRVLASHKKRAPKLEQQLLASIRSDLSRRTDQMTGRLAEIADNIQLIEVEIYNGASQDIIWQNAHPQYKDLAKKMKDDHEKTKELTWDWGRAPAGTEEASEIWEDELGSFKADLFDNCSSKDKFMALGIKSARK